METGELNSLSINPQNGNLWVSHGNGLIVFSPTGKMLKQIFKYSNYRFLPVDKRLYATPRELFAECDTAMQVFEPGSFLENPTQKPLSKTESLHQLAVLEGGG